VIAGGPLSWLGRLESFARAHLSPAVLDFAERVHAGQIVASMFWAIGVYGAIFGIVYLLERRAGRDTARYRTRNFVNDVLYTIFYKGGFFDVLLLVTVTNAFESRLAGVRVHVLDGLPWLAGLLLYWIAGDFVTYWWHRLQHSNRILWAFHSVHHSQVQVTMFTASRRHVLEMLSMVMLYFLGFHILLGIPTRGWMPLTAVITCLVAIQHAQLDWHLGPFSRIFVSPRFHAFHHSAETRHTNSNFGFLFSTWDYLFGTAVAEECLPARYGVDGLDMQESLWSQLITPFQLLRRHPRQVRTRVPAHLPSPKG
jgi:sterol desaturase/sphingolipid hydroxylase (fatty acid hydroxylase superfamily)